MTESEEERTRRLIDNMLEGDADMTEDEVTECARLIVGFNVPITGSVFRNLMKWIGRNDLAEQVDGIMKELGYGTFDPGLDDMKGFLDVMDTCTATLDVWREKHPEAFARSVTEG